MFYPEGNLYVTGSDWPHLAQRVNFESCWPTTDADINIDKTKPSILQQFTGLKDKNGQDIYEGDIIEDTHFGKNVVVFQAAAFKIMYIGFYTDNWETKGAWGNLAKKEWVNLDFFERGIVIGNVFENPELIK